MKECFGILGQAFTNSDSIGQLMVILLGVLSCGAWMIMGMKGAQIGAVRKGCKRFMKKYNSLKSPLAIAVRLEDDDEMPLDQVCRVGIDTLATVLDRDNPDRVKRMLEQRSIMPRTLTQAEIDKVKTGMISQMNRSRFALEDWMVGLSTIVTIAPFGGLLGTVWGVMMVFFQMGMSSGRPDIAQMAPGVSSALLTTVVGLLVAIPSVMGYNWLANSIVKTCTEMETFIDDFIASIRIEESDTDKVSTALRGGQE